MDSGPRFLAGRAQQSLQNRLSSSVARIVSLERQCLNQYSYCIHMIRAGPVTPLCTREKSGGSTGGARSAGGERGGRLRRVPAREPGPL